MPPDRRLGQEQEFAGRLPHPPDLAGIELPRRRRQPGGCAGCGAVHAGTAQGARPARSVRSRTGHPHAAHLLSDLKRQFGNLGLAAAAYTAGRRGCRTGSRAAGACPPKPALMFLAITGRAPEEWRTPATGVEYPEGGAPRLGRAGEAADLPSGHRRTAAAEPRRRFALGRFGGPGRPWGIQLAGNFSKALALQSFARTRATYAKVIGEVRPMIIGTRLRNRGTRAFYRIFGSQPRRGRRRLPVRQDSSGGRRVHRSQNLKFSLKATSTSSIRPEAGD